MVTHCGCSLFSHLFFGAVTAEIKQNWIR